MSELMRVAEVVQLLEPMFADMLEDDELASLEFRVARIDDGTDGPALAPEAPVEEFDAWVRWRVLGEEGGSGGLRIGDGPEVLVRFVQSDLQDFIAESGFGWGQLRGPRDVP